MPGGGGGGLGGGGRGGGGGGRGGGGGGVGGGGGWGAGGEGWGLGVLPVSRDIGGGVGVALSCSENKENGIEGYKGVKN